MDTQARSDGEVPYANGGDASRPGTLHRVKEDNVDHALRPDIGGQASADIVRTQSVGSSHRSKGRENIFRPAQSHVPVGANGYSFSGSVLPSHRVARRQHLGAPAEDRQRTTAPPSYESISKQYSSVSATSSGKNPLPSKIYSRSAQSSESDRPTNPESSTFSGLSMPFDLKPSVPPSVLSRKAFKPESSLNRRTLLYNSTTARQKSSSDSNMLLQSSQSSNSAGDDLNKRRTVCGARVRPPDPTIGEKSAHHEMAAPSNSYISSVSSHAERSIRFHGEARKTALAGEESASETKVAPLKPLKPPRGSIFLPAPATKPNGTGPRHPGTVSSQATHIYEEQNTRVKTATPMKSSEMYSGVRLSAGRPPPINTELARQRSSPAGKAQHARGHNDTGLVEHSHTAAMASRANVSSADPSRENITTMNAAPTASNRSEAKAASTFNHTPKRPSRDGITSPLLPLRYARPLSDEAVDGALERPLTRDSTDTDTSLRLAKPPKSAIRKFFTFGRSKFKVNNCQNTKNMADDSYSDQFC